MHPSARIAQCTVHGLCGHSRCPFFRGRGCPVSSIYRTRYRSISTRPHGPIACIFRRMPRGIPRAILLNANAGRAEANEDHPGGKGDFKQGASILTLEGAFRLGGPCDGRSAFPPCHSRYPRFLRRAQMRSRGRLVSSLSLSLLPSLFLFFFTGTADKGVRGFLRISCTYRDAYRALCITRAGNIMRPLLRREERSSSFLRLLPSPLSLLNAVDRSGSHGRRLMLICICSSGIRFTVFEHRIRDLASGRSRLARPKRRFSAALRAVNANAVTVNINVTVDVEARTRRRRR